MVVLFFLSIFVIINKTKDMNLISVYSEGEKISFQVTPDQIVFLNRKKVLERKNKKWMADFLVIMELLFDDHLRTEYIYSDGEVEIMVSQDELNELLKDGVVYMRNDSFEFDTKDMDGLINYIGGSWRQNYIIDWADDYSELENWKR